MAHQPDVEDIHTDASDIVSGAPDVENAAEIEESPSETVQTSRQLANTIFQTRQFEGEDLRMGQVLRRVREVLGKEVADVSAETRIRKDILVSIERMETNHFASGYLVPYLKTYAKCLGLPEKDLVKAYTAENGGTATVFDAAPVPKVGEIAPERAKWPLAVAAVLVLALIGGISVGVYSIFKPEATIEEVPPIVAVNGARDSLFSASVTTQRPLPETLPLEITAIRPSWLEVRGSDGTIFRSRVMGEGETYFPRLGAGWTVNARDGGAFVWRVGDLTIAPLGEDGAPVHSVSVDDQLVAAAEAAAPHLANVNTTNRR